MPSDDSLRTVRVWDLPTRVFHWLLAACVVGLIVTGKAGAEWTPWHARLGYAVGSLLLFRLVWGLAGGHWSRFGSFLYSPAALWRHLRGRGGPADLVGHSPLGALSVFAMLLVLLAQVTSGLFSANRDDFAGPLSVFVSNATVKAVSRYHQEIGELLVIALVVLHVLAIAWYRWRARRDLIGAMWHGDKQVVLAVPSARDDGASRLAALAVFGACAALVGWIASLGE
jgi:cytochrome b